MLGRERAERENLNHHLVYLFNVIPFLVVSLFRGFRVCSVKGRNHQNGYHPNAESKLPDCPMGSFFWRPERIFRVQSIQFN